MFAGFVTASEPLVYVLPNCRRRQVDRQRLVDQNPAMRRALDSRRVDAPLSDLIRDRCRDTGRFKAGAILGAKMRKFE